MCPHVYLEVTSGCAGVVTLCATERLFSTMCSHMHLQVRRRFTCIATLSTAKGLHFSTMPQHVSPKVVSFDMGKVTLMTFERASACLNLDVHIEIINCWTEMLPLNFTVIHNLLIVQNKKL